MLKLLRLGAGPHEQWPSMPNPADAYYWRREPLAYASGALETFGVPRLLAAAERRDGSVALWLEDGGDPLRPAPLDHLADVARRLGRAHAQLLGFDAPWLAHGWLLEYFRLHDLPLHDGVLDRFGTLQQTLCHNDFHPDNVLSSGMVVDWSFCGVGPVGMDAGVLVADGLADGWFAAELADDVLEVVWAAYTAGLGDDGDDVRFGFVEGIRRLRWLARGRSPQRDAILDLIERLRSDG